MGQGREIYTHTGKFENGIIKITLNGFKDCLMQPPYLADEAQRDAGIYLRKL